jgi:hypothetical protein
LEVGKVVGVVGEVKNDMVLRMTVVGEVLEVEKPEVLGEVERVVTAVGEPAEIHVTDGEGLDDRDGLIIEGLDLGLGNLKRENERVKRWVGSTVGQTGTDR